MIIGPDQQAFLVLVLFILCQSDIFSISARRRRKHGKRRISQVQHIPFGCVNQVIAVQSALFKDRFFPNLISFVHAEFFHHSHTAQRTYAVIMIVM